MALPDWRIARKGAKVRVALWLASEIGVGNSFTKADLRNAFPGVEQIDRRMRDLRAEGWVIATYREDRSLSADELRLVRLGGAVWEAGYRTKASASRVSDKLRNEIFAADGFACVFCGIGPGEAYPDDPIRTGRLTVARQPAEVGSPRLITVCERCHRRSGEDEVSADAIMRAIAELDAASRARIEGWISRGARSRDPLDELWGSYCRLSSSERADIRDRLQQR